MLRAVSLLAALVPAAADCLASATVRISPCDENLIEGKEPPPANGDQQMPPSWFCDALALEKGEVVPLRVDVKNGIVDTSKGTIGEDDLYPHADAKVLADSTLSVYLGCSTSADKCDEEQPGVLVYADVYTNLAGEYENQQGQKQDSTKIKKADANPNELMIEIKTDLPLNQDGNSDTSPAVARVGIIFTRATNFPDPELQAYKILKVTFPGFAAYAKTQDNIVVSNDDDCGTGDPVYSGAVGSANLGFLLAPPSPPPSPSPSISPPSEEGDEGEGNGGYDDDLDDDSGDNSGDDDDDVAALTE